MCKYNFPKKLVCFFLAFIFSSVFFADTVHVIKSGDTLYSLAREYKVSLDEIKKANNISDVSKIRVGQKLKIPSKNDASPKIAESDYIVVKGDTLYSIAKSHNCKLDEVLTLNKIDKNYKLKIGEKIKLPVSTVAISVASDNKPNDSEVASLKDPRNYTDVGNVKNTIWPIKASKIAYLTGKLYGVVLFGEKGASVEAIASGTIISASSFRGYGNVVIVRSSNGYIYAYCGVDSLKVNTGDEVVFGTTLGTLGSDPVSSKVQMFFVVYKGENPVDPAKAPRG